MNVIPLHGRMTGKTTALIEAAKASSGQAVIVTISAAEAERVRRLVGEDPSVQVMSVTAIRSSGASGWRTEFFLDNGELLISTLLAQYSDQELLQLLFPAPIAVATFEGPQA
jgi:hypothetical protein